jgi:hypothetical protein
MEISENREPTMWRIFKEGFKEKLVILGTGWAIVGTVLLCSAAIGGAMYGLWYAIHHSLWWSLYIIGFILLNVIAYAIGRNM